MVAGNECIDWAGLRCAYGAAEQVPELLRRAEDAGTDFGDEWNDLWSQLCHQGTVYTASYAAFPALAAMCLRLEPRGFMAPLQLAGAIIASDDAPDGAEQMRGQLADEIGQLGALAERCVELAVDDVEFIYGLETLTAFENRGIWSRNLGYLADGEVPLDCTACGKGLLVQIAELPAEVIDWDASRPATTVEPTDHLTSVGERLVSLAAQNNRPHVVSKLRSIFGRAVCPACGAAFLIGAALD